MNEHPTSPSPDQEFGPFQWWLDAFRRYVDFKGRTRRSGFWWFVLIQWGIQVVLSLVAPAIASLHVVASLLPGLAVGTRRLHDTDRSGWWWAIHLIPVIGQVIFLVFMASDGTRGANRHGPDPKTGEAEPVVGGFCASCGNAVDADAAFCGTCGARRG